MNNNSSNSSLQYASRVVTISLAGVSTIACIIALVALLYFKLWRKFIYRLMLYMFVSLIILSSSLIILVSSMHKDTNYYPTDVYILYNETAIIICISNTIVDGSIVSAAMFVMCTNISVYLMALHNYQFSYKTDLWLVIPSILPISAIASELLLIFFNEYYDKYTIIILSILASIIFSVNIIFTLLTLVPMCARACGFNLCTKTTASKESHRKALKEVLPLYILIIPSLFSNFLTILFNSTYLNYIFIDFVYRNLNCCVPGILCGFSFGLHIFFIRKNLNTLRGKRRPLGAMCSGINKRRTYHTTAYTSEGISETCNTEHLYVSESESDTQFLNQKNNLAQHLQCT